MNTGGGAAHKELPGSTASGSTTLVQATFRRIVAFTRTASGLRARISLGTTATLVIAVITLWPKLGVVADQSLTSDNIFRTPYEVQNQSYFSLYSAEYTCEPTHLEYKNGLRLRIFLGYTAPKLASETLAPNDKRTIVCPVGAEFPPPSTISNLDLRIIVRFRLPIMPIHMMRCFRFVTAKDETGLRLFPEPVDDKCAWPSWFMVSMVPAAHGS
jgi:hypothetical protein